MYIYIYIYTHIYIYIYIYTCIHIHNTYTYIYTRIHTHTYIYTYIYTHTHSHTHMHIPIYVHIYLHIHIYIHIKTYILILILPKNNSNNVNLNINYICYKFEDLIFFCTNYVDILLIGETKLDSSFPDAQMHKFFIEDYNKPLRLDVSGRSGGLLVFTKSHLPTRQLTELKIPMDIQIIIFELNLRKEKWLVVSVHKLPDQDASYFLTWLSQIIDFYSITYEKQVITGDFSLTADNKSMREFVDLYNLINLIKTITCFKGTGSCVDLLLKNQKSSFKSTNTFETGLSDHHLLIYSMVKT